MSGGSTGAAKAKMALVAARQYSLALLAAVLLAVAYGLLLAFFQRTDFYHAHFFDHGAIVQAYQAARLVFILFLGWLIYAVGAGAMMLACGAKVFLSLPPVDRYPLSFVFGAGIWHVVLFATGLLGLDTAPVMLVLTLGVMLLSVPHLAVCLRELQSLMADARVRSTWGGLLKGTVMLATAGAFGLFLLVKSLYPGGGHDYFNHYFQFYMRVVETGSILPNDVWYHFFYSKGAGLYFMAMLLTDPLAPALVTTAFIACGAAIVFALLGRSAKGTLLPWFAVALYFGLLIYTPGPGQNRSGGGWGDLEKIHELSAVLLLAIVWIGARLFNDDVESRRPWWLALCAAIMGVALLTLPLVPLVGLYLVLLMAWFALRGRWRRALQPFAAAALAGACVLAMGAVNYHYTGMPTDQFVVRLWPYFDLMKIAAWGTLYEVLVVHHAYYGSATHSMPSVREALVTLGTFLRLELWWPLVTAALPFAVWNLARRPTGSALPTNVANVFSALSAFALAVVLAAIFSNSLSPPSSISFYRLSSFSYGPALCAALLLWSVRFRDADAARPRAVFVSVALSVGAALVPWALQFHEQVVLRANFVDTLCKLFRLPTVGNALRMADGRFSIHDAYENQAGGLNRMPWGGIYPAMETVWRIAGPGTRIWSFHFHSYCMLPGCNTQGSVSVRFSPSWPTVLFGTPEEARGVLEREGLNYFFFSKELATSTTDLLPASDLFSRNQIGKYLGIRWTDGTSYLLTWLGPGVEPISEKFLAEFRARLEGDGYDIDGMRRLWRPVSDHVTSHRDDLRPFAAPWCTNPLLPCQWMSDGAAARRAHRLAAHQKVHDFRLRQAITLARVPGAQTAVDIRFARRAGNAR